jgi:hypothetical protein
MKDKQTGTERFKLSLIIEGSKYIAIYKAT